MRNGDLSNAPVPRMIIVFENAIGYLPDDRRPEWHRLSRLADWDGVARLFELDQIMLRKIVDLTHRFSVSIDVVTYCGPDGFARALSDLFDRENVPVRIVYASTPERVGRKTSFEPDIITIYDGNPEHQLAYGRKGRYLSSPDMLGS